MGISELRHRHPDLLEVFNYSTETSTLFINFALFYVSAARTCIRACGAPTLINRGCFSGSHEKPYTNLLDQYLTLSQDIHTALKNEDIVGLERIIKKVGAEAAFGVHLTEDFTGRRLIHYMEHYASGLQEYRARIHPELLALALKYDPHLKLEDRLRYLHIFDSFLDKWRTGLLRGRDLLAFARRVDEESIVKLRKLILDHAPDDEKNLMQKLCFIKDKYKSEPES